MSTLNSAVYFLTLMSNIDSYKSCEETSACSVVPGVMTGPAVVSSSPQTATLLPLTTTSRRKCFLLTKSTILTPHKNRYIYLRQSYLVTKECHEIREIIQSYPEASDLCPFQCHLTRNTIFVLARCSNPTIWKEGKAFTWDCKFCGPFMLKMLHTGSYIFSKHCTQVLKINEKYFMLK